MKRFKILTVSGVIYINAKDRDTAITQAEAQGYTVRMASEVPLEEEATPTPTPTPTSTTPTTTTPTTTSGLRDLSKSEKSGWIGVTDWDVTLSERWGIDQYGHDILTKTMAGNYQDILYQLETMGVYPVRIRPAQEYYDEYEYYRQFLKSPQGEGWPDVDIKEYFANRQTFLNAFDSGVPPGQVSTAQPGFTDEQTREYNLWWDWYNKYGETGERKPVSIEDYYNNHDEFQGLMSTFQERAGVAETEQAEAEAYTREQREYQKYVRQEAFQEPARLSETFSAWIGQQGQLSGAFSEFVESKYPSLRGTFEAGMPIETGYPTREAARAAAAQRESQWQAWLPQQIPGKYQEYMGQRPGERGERLWMQAPATRTVNW